MNPADASQDLSALEFALLNRYQRGFPLLPRPFEVLAQQLGSDEPSVIDHLRRLQQRGLVSRVGAVFRPNAIGASALAALAVPPDQLETVADLISALPEVNHNYQREHHYNLWFVVAASSAERLHAALRQIEAICQCGAVLVLPLLEDFHIDLGFDLSMRAGKTFTYTTPQLPARDGPDATLTLNETQQTLVAALQHGLPWVARPYAELGVSEPQALEMISDWLTSGVIKRLGVVVRHHELGYHANAMAVWDVPDHLASQIGREVAATGRVTLCYRRNRQLPSWPYNLFCMIHGKDRGDVAARVEALSRLCQLDAYPHAVLFSCRRFKQCGALYAPSAELVHG